VKAFRATLEEVIEASLLLHVVDASSPYAPDQTAHVLHVLHEIGAGETPQLLVLNKLDLLPEADAGNVAQRVLGEARRPESWRAVSVSAKTGAGAEELLAAMDRMLDLDPVSRAVFRLPAGDGGLTNLLHERAVVLGTRYDDDWCEVEAEVPESVRRRLAAYIVQ
jgi:GTP-binding protein HflX